MQEHPGASPAGSALGHCALLVLRWAQGVEFLGKGAGKAPGLEQCQGRIAAPKGGQMFPGMSLPSAPNRRGGRFLSNAEMLLPSWSG